MSVVGILYLDYGASYSNVGILASNRPFPAHVPVSDILYETHCSLEHPSASIAAVSSAISHYQSKYDRDTKWRLGVMQTLTTLALVHLASGVLTPHVLLPVPPAQ